MEWGPVVVYEKKMTALTRGLVAAATVLLWTAPGSAQGDVCSRDTLGVDGTPVEVTLCVPPAPVPRKGDSKQVTVSVTETFAAGGATFTRSVPLDFLDGGETSRTIDDVALAKLGIKKSLHLTIAYHPGSVRLEHVLLVPGAVTLK
jgi:hypothetical protein